MDDFCVFILTHGRPDRVYTYNTLKSHGYSGKIYLVIDNEDKSEKEYIERYGKEVIKFDKVEASKRFDNGDNFNDRRAIVYARNECFEIAKKIGVKYFLQLDDDYTNFVYKFDENMAYKESRIFNLDSVFECMLKYYKSIDAITIAMAQNGDFIGGKNGSFAKNIKPRRKCMNTFFCSTESPFSFVGRINEDVNTYTSEGGRGKLLLTIPNVAIIQKQTQSNSGGMTDLYLDSGTYIKSFYSVMYSPSCVKVSEMGDKHKRLHHRVRWNNAVPVILDESVKKR
jgi:hypothetical protein